MDFRFVPFINPVVLSVNFLYYSLINYQIFFKDQPNNRIDYQKYNMPKITIINLDGFDHRCNLKIIEEYEKTVQYISIFDGEVLAFGGDG